MLRTANFMAIVASIVFTTIAAGSAANASETDATSVSFYRDVRPILQARCQGCHQPAKAGGGYVMTSVAAMQREGDSELSGVVPSKPNESYLVEQITPEGGVAAMPQEGEPLGDEQIALITRWIAEGANDDTPDSARRRYDAQHPPEYTRPPVITSLDISPDGSLIAVAAFHEVVLCETSGGDEAKPIARLIGMSERIASVAFSPDGTKLAVTGGSPARMGEVQIWDVASRELELSLPVTFDTVYGASWSPDGKLLAFGCADNTVRAIDAESGEQVLFQGAHSDWVLDTVFSADGAHLASVGRDATAKLIEVGAERFVDNITSITPGALRGGIHAVTRHPQRDEILFGGADGVPKIYQMHRTTKRVIGDDANLLWQLPPLPGRVFSVDYSADGSLIAAGSSLDGAGAVHIYGIEREPKIPEDVKAILVKPTHARSPEEGAKLAKHFADGIKVVAELSLDDGGIYAVAISPDGRRVAAAGASGTIRVIDATSGDVIREFIPVELSDPNPTPNAKNASLARSAKTELPERLANESLPDDAEVESLAIQPESIQLETSTAYAQLIVTATLASGDVVDVTRLVHLQVESPVVAVSPSGLVQSQSDGVTTLTATLLGKSVAATVDVTGATAPLTPDYVRDISPILARAGCNAGTCHGAQDGKNGFKLSLRGYDPIFDVRSLADDLASRRTDLASPAQSLMLLKPTASVPHEGGQLFEPGDDYYRTLLAWIERGVELDAESPRVVRIDVTPVNPIVQTIGSRQQVRVVAAFADGSRRDVTREAFVESGDTEIAKPVDGFPGLLEVLRRGEAPVLVRYEGAYAATTVTVMGDRSGFVWQEPPVNNEIDELIHAKLQRTKTAPSPLCDDYTFVRRLYLDLTGLPPTPEQIANFQNDHRDSQWKRNHLIDQLIGSDQYVEHWSNKWADMLQVNSKFLGREGAESLRQWIRSQVEANRPYDEFASEVLTASGSTKENPPASYYKILREPEITMENTTHLFLSTRFNCNKCHDHPFERWTQDQYYQMSAFFARVGFKKDPASGDQMVGGTSVRPATPLYEEVFTKPDGEVAHLRTGKVAEPEFPFECEHQCDDDATRRERLAAWITSPDNPYFAKSYANRIWAYLTGRGLIEPIDDIRAGNPPTNPELLDWLTAQFIESGFDVQGLTRTICRSRTYQLAIDENEFNADDELNYSHARTRRLPAEVLYDAIYHTTGAQSAFPGVPKGTRAAALPDVGIQLPDGFLNNLGRPARESSCECERTNELQMGPIMALINGATVGQAVGDSEGEIAKLAASEPDDRRMVEKLFLRILARPAVEGEIADALDVINAIDEQHSEVVAQLKSYQAELAPVIAKREAERASALESARGALAAREKAFAPELQRLTAEREQRIAAAKSELQATRESLIAKLPAWEVARLKETKWEALTPIEMSATSGAMLAARDDCSVVVTGTNGAKTTYQFTAPADLSGVTGLRLEALTDDSLPKKGPGRAPDGNFVVTELKLAAAQAPLEPALIESWDFSRDANGWIPADGSTFEQREGTLIVKHQQQTPRLSKFFAAPAGPMAVEITAKFAQETLIKLGWQTEAEQHFGDGRLVERRVSPGGDWRTFRLYFEPTGPLQKIKLEFLDSGAEVSIDSIRIVRAMPPEFTPVKLANAKADFSQASYAVATAIDGQADGNNNGWAIAPQMGANHVAIFETTDEYGAGGDGAIRAELIQNYSSGQHTLGRFRLSITRSPRPIDFGLPSEIADLLVVAVNERTEQQQAMVIEYYLAAEESFIAATAKLAAAEQPLPPDAEAVAIEARIAQLEQPLPDDPKLVGLRRAAELSKQQLSQKRLTAAQDVAWALINSPEFLYNH